MPARSELRAVLLPLVLAAALLACLSSPLSPGPVNAAASDPRSAPSAVPAASGEAERLPPVLQAGAIQEPPPLTVYMPFIGRRYFSPLPVFGVQMEPVTEAGGLVQATAAGVRWVRSRQMRWDKIEPERTSPPTYKWLSWVDEQFILNAQQNGLTWIGVIHGTPTWAQAVPGRACGPILSDALDEFDQFLRALVGRYSQPPYSVHVWEVWNEPDVDPSQVPEMDWYGCWGDLSDPFFGGSGFAEMLKVAYPAIKQTDPTAQVWVGGLLLDCDPNNPPPGKDCASAHFLEGILQGGGGPYFDAVAFHCYSYGSPGGSMTNANWLGSVTAIPEKAGFLRGVLSAYGYDATPLANTEAALICDSPTPDCLEAQAMYMGRAYAEALALNLRVQSYYTIVDEWRNTGLLKWEGGSLVPKAGYYGYATASGFLSRVRYAGPLSGYPEGVSGYSFNRRDGAGALDVIWSSTGDPIAVDLPADIAAYDRYGNEIDTRPVLVDLSPVYVVWP